MTKAQKLVGFAWSLAFLVVLAAVSAWLEEMDGRLRFNSYVLFPLFGLLAFSLMWTHYIVGAVRRHYSVPKKFLKSYFSITGVVVLAAILLHPTLLIFQLWRDGFGLPPNSYLENYVAPTGKFAVLLGSMSFVIFLCFELKRKFGDRKWWKIVDYAQLAAMAAIFYHALQLGGALQIGWFRTLWFFYGVTFLIAIGYIYLFNTSQEKNK